MKKSLVIFFTFLLLILGMSACGQSTEDQWLEQYDLGVRYLLGGNYEEAIIAFTAAIEIDPMRTEAYSGLANAYLAKGDYESAAAVWTDAQSQTTDEALLSAFADSRKQYADIRAGLESEEPGIWITSMAFDRKSLLAGEETVFQLTTIYRAPDIEALRLSLYANIDDPRSWECQNKYENIAAGVGVCQMEISITPTLWEGPYFGIRVALQDISDSADRDWIVDNSRYITPEGETVNHYSPLNAYGAIEFIYRDHYKEFSTLDTFTQSRIETLAKALLSGDQDYLLSLAGTDIGFGGPINTMWNGYKVEILDYDRVWKLRDYEANNINIGLSIDRHKSFSLEMRPEDGTGYFCSVFRMKPTTSDIADEYGGMAWCDYVTVTTCPCADWRWNGEVRSTCWDKSLYRFEEIESSHSTVTSMSGTMVDGLWDGESISTFWVIDDWSSAGPDGLGEGFTNTLMYEDGILTELDGEPWTADKNDKRYYCLIEGEGVPCSNEEYYLDCRYW